MITFLIIVLLVLLLMGFPLKVPLLAATLLSFWLFWPTLDPVIVVQQMIGGIKPAALLAVPMFIFAADIMTRGQTANRLLDLVEKFIGHMRGGLPMTTAVACTLFGAVSGSTQATVVAIGSPLRPKLIKAGYSDKFATALIINSSDIALLIPPSIGMIVYGVVSGTSIGELFIAGITPGLLILFCFCLYSYYRATQTTTKEESREAASWAQRGGALKKAIFPLGFPLIIIGGIYGGIFSPTEAAGVSVLYALILEMVIFKEFEAKQLWDVAVSTGMITALVFILVAAGGAFSWLISYAELPQILINDVIGLSAQSSHFKILVTIAIAFFVGCMFVDPIVVILIMTPIFHPIAVDAGIDPVLVGILVTLQVAIGSATPPFGCDIFTAVAVFKKPYLDVIRGTPPFIVMLLVVSLIVMLYPPLTLFLRDIAFQ